MQYGGANDNFGLCLKIFYDQCRKVGIMPHSLSDAFSVMLKGKAREFHYDRIIGRFYNFQETITQIQQHFKTDDRHQHMLHIWNTLTLSTVVEENPDKPLAECFEILLEIMQKT
ncbi:hypothetical protein EPUL_001716 [Erysiphe pulchra]|uniref:Uncharacterized protein n=1 Tax=Erysiphe pulchra TaxID=225359 RepID=A0A2S4PZY6_9PEZI|nr:hypothetical protein EPUL_001716 [Erysiphe pulchra]